MLVAEPTLKQKLEETRQAMAWWNSLPAKERALLSEEFGGAALTEIRKYWQLNIKGNV